MAITLSDLIITSDIDGTLLNAPNPIPPRNLAALARFTAKGGRFALATGRSIESARQYVRQLPVNAPCVIFNGGGVYDFRSEELLYARYLPETFPSYPKKLMQRFPKISMVLLDDRDMYSIGPRYFVEKYLSLEKLPFLERSIDTLSGSFFKMIMAMDEESVPLVEAFANKQGWEDVTFVRSSPFYLEMLPVGCDKGSGLRELARVLELPMPQIVSIGDYYNDCEMLKATGFPVTVAGAPDDIKRICKLVTGPCDSGALADLIEYLEAHYPAA